eukprot:TRINITY_DN4389_c0_g1::TRINITY_DN4389_c0_g1_i1::g.21232::m.21232 TRINITY_DN4389_c0_g1::TRINITY_DN4389_c0_g1_i1::g.21232  ORF type:complete len:215 (-),score=20.17 TRINITY_DN4389_c0_g1_i1:165-755(-)
MASTTWNDPGFVVAGHRTRGQFLLRSHNHGVTAALEVSGDLKEIPGSHNLYADRTVPYHAHSHVVDKDLASSQVSNKFSTEFWRNEPPEQNHTPPYSNANVKVDPNIGIKTAQGSRQQEKKTCCGKEGCRCATFMHPTEQGIYMRSSWCRIGDEKRLDKTEWKYDPNRVPPEQINSCIDAMTVGQFVNGSKISPFL